MLTFAFQYVNLLTISVNKWFILHIKEGNTMISEIHTHEDPILTREEAIEILNTPDDQLDTLIERA